jgi:hypothetical protein
MNLRQTSVRASKIKSKNLALRKQLWPKLDSDLLWDRTQQKGFTTIPRPMPYILQIMDNLAPKGKPVSETYLSLWCRVFDESLVVIQNPSELAFESGFTGQRDVTTWASRMSYLENMGFIATKDGASGKYNYVLLYNPYVVIKKQHAAKKIQETQYNALFARGQDVGATDLLED